MAGGDLHWPSEGSAAPERPLRTFGAPLPLGPFAARLSYMSDTLITASSDIMGGTPVFAGTRVPVQTLFDYLEAGDTIDDFLEGFPTVTREQVVVLLETAKGRVLAEVK
jgi:uncharacterized protein (DUF433 family)